MADMIKKEVYEVLLKQNADLMDENELLKRKLEKALEALGEVSIKLQGVVGTINQHSEVIQNMNEDLFG